MCGWENDVRIEIPVKPKLKAPTERHTPAQVAGLWNLGLWMKQKKSGPEISGPDKKIF